MRAIATVLAAAGLLAIPVWRSAAQTVWIDPGVDDWFDPANWSAGLPNPAFDARISNGGTARILAGSAEVQHLTIGSMGGESGTLTIMNPGSLLNAATLIVGDAGSGTLSITAGADLMAGTVTIANSGGFSMVTVNGAGSTLTTMGVLTVGRAGNGTITIDAGAVVTSPDVQLGFLAGGVGMAVISGAGTRWDVSGQFTVGGGLSGGGPGSGSLTVSGGALVDVSNAVQDIGKGVVVIANQAGTTGEATVTGAGSSLIASNAIFVANRGQGVLTISDGGLVRSDLTAIGYENGSVGTMVVTGTGSRFEDTYGVFVGNLMGSTGTLTVADGGAVAISAGVTGGLGRLEIAFAAGSTGTVNIGSGGAPGTVSANEVLFGSGTGMLNFNHTGLLVFGVPIRGGAGLVTKLGSGDTVLTGVNTWSGSLVVRGGSVQLGGSGEINNLFGSIAPEIGNVAAVLVNNGSRWTTTANIHVGERGDGLLQVESGGVVESGSEILVERFAEGRGELVVTGAGSSVSAASELRVADEGLGILRVENGGLLTSNKGFLARNAGTANATATVTGANSRWNIANEINVGGFGDATLTVSAGGVLTSGTGNAFNYIGGYDANGSGLVTVTGAGSQWTLGSFLGIANAGIAAPGELRVLAGSAVSGTSLGIGPTGSLTVTGTDSMLAMNSGISIGGSAVIEAGAVVSNPGPFNTGLSLDASGMTPASLRIDGAGSQWTTADFVTVGFSGLADLTIRNGGIINDGRSFMSFTSTGRGNVIVEGAGSAWNHLGNAPDGSNGFMFVGGDGNATLTIRNGGVVTTQNANTISAAIALNPGSTSTVLVTGEGSAWMNAGGLVVGDLGKGTLTIADGATVTAGGGAGDVLLAASALNNPNAAGTLNIGAGGLPGTLQAARVLLNGQPGIGQSVVNFDHTGEVVIGAAFSGRGFLQQINTGKTILTGDSVLDPNFGFFSVFTGTFEISGGGTMSAPLNFVGYSAAPGVVSDGTAIVRGADSSWTATSNTFGVQVGGADIPGHLDVLEGALLSVIGLDVSRNIAFPSAAPGDVDVDGTGSRVMATGVIDVGVHGVGAFRVSNGGSVMSQLTGADSVIVGDTATGIGTITVNGAGSSWTSAGEIKVGALGAGTIRLEAGGAMSGTGLRVSNPSSVTITGTGSLLTMTETIVVEGSMRVEAGARVSHPAPLFSGLFVRGGTGAVVIDGAGSQWDTADFVVVGSVPGAGSLTIRNGGVMNDSRGLLGFGFNSSPGTAIVEGAGSEWNHLLTFGNHGILVVGNDADATLTIRDGGLVTTAQTNFSSAQIAVASASTAIATVTGADSAWTNAGGMVVGVSGDATLNIADGATVTAGGGTGTVFIGMENNSHGTVNIGTGAAPGTLRAGSVVFAAGAGTRALNFNHTGDLAFTIPISGPGVVTKLGAGTTTLSVDNSYSGGTTVSEGVLRVTNPNGLGLGSGTVTVFSPAAGASTLTFSGSASAGAAAISIEPGLNGVSSAQTVFQDNATAATANITTQPSVTTDDVGGRLSFTGNARAGMAQISNAGATVRDMNFGNGITDFFGGTADSATITNRGSPQFLARGGWTRFHNDATAGTSMITNERGAGGGVFGSGGNLVFYDGSVASTATIINQGGDANGAPGTLDFNDTASADGATITNQGSSSSNGGSTRFFQTSTAGQAMLTMEPALSASGFGGDLRFYNFSTADTATLRLLGGTGANLSGGTVAFYQSSTAAGATITLDGGTAANAPGGSLYFLDNSTAGAAMIGNKAPAAGTTNGGRTEFRDSATAGTAMIMIEAGGRTQFFNTSSAMGATFTLQRSSTIPGANLEFRDDSSAGTATIMAGPRAVTFFFDSSEAGSATFINQGDTVPGGAFGGSVTFTNSASAMNATIINSGGSVDFGYGFSNFFGDSSAGSAQIICEGALAPGSPAAFLGGGALFYDMSDAGSSTITAEGSSVNGAMGGFIYFAHFASAENATLIANGGDNGGLGGTIQFYENASGENASVVANGNSVLDITSLTSSGTTLGSMAGSGSFLLGAKNLAVGSNHASTVVSGSISGSGAFTKTGTGTLTLSGANSFTGNTFVNDGRLHVDGTLASNVIVNKGSLSGTGTLNNGARIGNFVGSEQAFLDPGASIGTITVAAALSFTPRGTYRWQLNSNAQEADRVIVPSGNVFLNLGGQGRLLTLDLGNTELPLGMSFTILEKQSAGAISDTFFGFPEGAEFDLFPNRFRISYVGGNGNDIVLVNTIPEPGSFVLTLVGTAALRLRRRPR